jgi:hypothetical protein
MRHYMAPPTLGSTNLCAPPQHDSPSKVLEDTNPLSSEDKTTSYIRPSGMLGSVVWQLVTNVLGQPVCHIFSSSSETSVTNFQSTLRNIPEG